MRKAKAFMFRSLPMMISCREFEEFLIDYFEGSLPKRQRFVFEMHLKLCRECREYLVAFKRTIDISKRVFADLDEQVPDDVPDDLVRAILDAREA
jgi:anti-sigma factor RsiW